MEYVVSGCLAGLKCKYNGGSNPCPQVIELVRTGKAIPICPESLSGLPVPRDPCEWQNDRLISREGADWTVQICAGAEKALARALESGACKAILKSRSPSCGYGKIYDGSFSGTLRKGNGIWARKLLEHGFQIYTEENLPESIAPADLP